MSKITVHDLEGHQYEIVAENYEDDGGTGDGGVSGINFTAYATFSVSEAVQIAREILPSQYDIVKEHWDDDGNDCLCRYGGERDGFAVWTPIKEGRS